MSQITAEIVNTLRQRTGAGIMDCKKALVETNGDVDAAVDSLRKRGVAVAAKKAGRAASDGVIAQYIQPGAKNGLLVEINCETDFVAKNDIFREFSEVVAKTLSENPQADVEPLRVAIVAKIGENIVITRHERYVVNGNGAVAAYIHMGWLNADDAINLDGGGSTTLWINNYQENGIVNFPTDNKKWDHEGQRKVANVVLLKKNTSNVSKTHF